MKVYTTTVELTAVDGAIYRWASHPVTTGGAFFPGGLIRKGSVSRDTSDPGSAMVTSSYGCTVSDLGGIITDPDTLDGGGLIVKLLTVEQAERSIDLVYSEDGQAVNSDDGTLVQRGLDLDGQDTLLHERRIFTGLVVSTELADGQVMIGARSMDHAWRGRRFVTTITRERFPNAAESAIGSVGPIIYGTVDATASEAAE
jgi:hypothetical protein